MIVTHTVLKRQLKRLNLNEDSPPTLEQWHAILKHINQSYKEADQEQYLNELSITVSSREMSEKNKELSATINKLHKLQEQIIHSEKIATLNQLSGGIAHEINNPLSYTISNIEALDKRILSILNLLQLYQNLDEKITLEELKKLLAEITHFANEHRIATILAELKPIITETKDGLFRIKEIVKSLSHFNELKNLDNQYINVNDCIKAAIEILKDKLMPKCEIHLHLNELPTVLGIPNELEVVFISLLLNAEQSIQHKGKIIITSKVRDNNVVISIEDNGCGISPEDLHKLFTPFFTTKPIGTAIGLGLATVQKIITFHNGTISVESTENKGSIFTITIPVKLISTQENTK